MCRIGIRDDLGIFPLIGIANFERGVRAQFVAERRRARNVTLANLTKKCLQCGNNLN